MADLITWSGNGGISFFVNANEIRGIKDISISSSVETEDQTKSKEKYIKKKNTGSYQLTLTAVLNAALGVDVREVALKITEAARKGSTGYFYTVGSKLFPSKFMCTDAKISGFEMTGTGVWKYCEVSMTLKQCSKYGGGTSSAKKTKKSKSKKSSSTKRTKSKKTPKNNIAGPIRDQNRMDVNRIPNKKSDILAANGITRSAKAASLQAYKNLTTRKVNKSTGGISKLSKHTKSR